MAAHFPCSVASPLRDFCYSPTTGAGGYVLAEPVKGDVWLVDYVRFPFSAQGEQHVLVRGVPITVVWR